MIARVQSALCDLDATDHPAGVLTDQPVTNLGQSHPRKRVADALLALLARHQVQPCAKQNILVTGQIAGGREQLRDVTDAAADLGRLRAQVGSGDARAAFRWRQHRRQPLDQHALAGSIGTDEPEDLSGGNAQRCGIDDRQRSEAPGEPEGLDHRITDQAPLCHCGALGQARKSTPAAAAAHTRETLLPMDACRLV